MSIQKMEVCLFWLLVFNKVIVYMCMYFLIRNGYCVGVSESLAELEQQKQNDDVIKEMKDEKTADEIFTIDAEGNLVKR